VPEAAFDKALPNIQQSLDLLKQTRSRLVKIDPRDAFYGYAKYALGPYKFHIGLDNLSRPDVVKSVTTQWKKILDAVDHFKTIDAPFYDDLHDAIKRRFGASKGRHLAYSIVAAMVRSTGKRWWS